MTTGTTRKLGVRGRFAAVAALVLAGLVVGAGPALAHDQIDESNPEDGSTVATVPDEITMTFNNIPLAMGSVAKVTGPGGDVTEGKATIVDHTLTQPVAAGAPAGEYTVQWRVTSSDGHPISGQFTFTAEAGSEGAAPAATATAGAGETSTTVTTPADAGATASVSDAVAAADQNDDSGTSPVLIITLIVLAVLVIGAVAYVFVLAPKRSSEN
ncbi:copper resistance CopC family protein [Kineosporia succinea]|uniref:Methionine-rich copper-binding protein CopC n=1 Tax=Kineosporia succinea TaxID=84632 RepID=A0ABT9NX00_9ACTN|nr:copper resistance CopC family protein [Kineosporia succinea]MDP9824836.1 methionine-rich copper-binding protein CopC [Kineosporia succinea]